jgi:hypothetical protein
VNDVQYVVADSSQITTYCNGLSSLMPAPVLCPALP